MKARTTTIAASLLLTGALVLGACGGGGEKPEIGAVVDRHAAELVAIEGVAAVAAGKDGAGLPCIHVWLEGGRESLRGKLPEELEGYPVRIKMTRGFVAVDTTGTGGD